MHLFLLPRFFRRLETSINCFVNETVSFLFHVDTNLSRKQRLTAGDDPFTAFLVSSEAALAGAEATKDMQAQVNFLLLSSLVIVTI